MPDCHSIDPLVTPYVDGELADADRVRVDQHLHRCPPCHARVAAERAVRDLIRERRRQLERECAPPALRTTCAALAAQTGPRDAWPGGGRAPVRTVDIARRWTATLAGLAAAAVLVLFVGGAFLYRLTDSSARVMAAELTADHVKCFAMNGVVRPNDEPSAVQSAMLSLFGWPVRLPDPAAYAGLELVGARPCLYGEGRVAHLMYRHHGTPVSVFMLPGTVRPEEVVEVMGHEAAVWSSGSRTFVLIAREPRDDVQQIASFVRASLE
jgi:anti-sigma factor RsiW